jgi:hypothetical protein
LDRLWRCGKLEVAERDMLEEFPNEKVNYETQDIKQGLTDYDWLVQSLEKHAERLQNSEYESPGVAELISRSFIAITEGCNNYSSQKNINQTIAAVKPLWEYYRFYHRYIRPY